MFEVVDPALRGKCLVVKAGSDRSGAGLRIVRACGGGVLRIAELGADRYVFAAIIHGANIVPGFMAAVGSAAHGETKGLGFGLGTDGDGDVKVDRVVFTSVREGIAGGSVLAGSGVKSLDDG